jgi:hypothetical protein
MTANTPRSRKAKGRSFQNRIRGDIISRLSIDPGDILSTAMGQAGCDIYLSPEARKWFPFAIECKNQEKVSLWPWWDQCVTNAAKEELAPLLLIRRSRTEPLAVLWWDDFLAIQAAHNNWMMLAIDLLARAMAADIPADSTEEVPDDKDT